MVRICRAGIQVVKCMLPVTSRGAEAASKSSRLEAEQTIKAATEPTLLIDRNLCKSLAKKKMAPDRRRQRFPV